MKRFIAIGLILLVSACATVAGKTAQQRVFGLEKDFSALMVGIKPYMALPACMEGQTLLVDNCSDKNSKAAIAAGAVDAWSAIKAAENTVRALPDGSSVADTAIVAAVNAVSAFRAILDNNGVAKWAHLN